jgi:hypothetical protein
MKVKFIKSCLFILFNLFVIKTHYEHFFKNFSNIKKKIRINFNINRKVSNILILLY